MDERCRDRDSDLAVWLSEESAETSLGPVLVGARQDRMQGIRMILSVSCRF